MKSRNPWPIAITAFFVIAIIFIATFITWAVQQREDLVSADYYEREVRFQNQLDSMNRSRDIATQPVVTFEPTANVIVVTLPRDKSVGATGKIHLYRPSDARLDREIPLALDVTGIQKLDAKNLPGGLWKVRVQWTAASADYFVDQPVIVPSI